ncbi:hypothetical protein Xcc1_29140 [Xanthomonas campestris pv. campestris]|nr:hypothetical protein Xcc1_29140 [Xanthomonas campestris pv. campestris]
MHAVRAGGHTMKRKQSGMTLTSFVVVLAVVGFALYLGMKLFPDVSGILRSPYVDEGPCE